MLSKRATGLSSYIVDLTTRLLDDGHEVTILATDCGYRGADAGELVELDPRARTIIFPVRNSIDRKIYRCTALADWFGRHVHEFDLLDIQGIWAIVNIEVAKIAEKALLPYIVTPHGMLAKWDWTKRYVFKRALYHIGVDRLLQRASVIRFLSKGEAASTAISLSTPTVIIPNAVGGRSRISSENVRERICKQYGISADTKIILFVGRMCHQKGTLELVQAFDLLYQERSDISLVLVGPMEKGEYATVLKDFVNRTKAAKRIHVLGPIFGSTKYDFYQSADVFVTLSRNEGLSLASLEALSYGLPLVITKDSNLPEVAEFSAGKITICEPLAAKQSLAMLLNDDHRLLDMKSNAISLFDARFSWSVVLPELVDLYGKIAKSDNFAPRKL